ncbi:MAG: response regulator transcription factor [Acidimicrobiia bacterium]
MASAAALAPSARTILIIEDEAPIAAAVAARLRSEGFSVEVAADGPVGVERCHDLRPDLVVLDLMLPGLDGLEVCEHIQADRPVPVLMLTARDSERDLVVGLGVGADDYMTKPFSTRELVARVHALLRRIDRDRAEAETDAAGPPSQPVRVGNVSLDPGTRRVTRDGEVVHLTPTEFDLFAFLATAPDRVFTREELLAEVWGYEVASGGRTVDSHVRAVRQKLGNNLIRTVHGVGYALDEAGAE